MTTALAIAVAALASSLWAAARPRPGIREGVSGVPEPPPDLPPGRVVAVPGHGEMFVREAGDPAAPTVLLLHGWMFPSDLTWWQTYGGLAEFAHVIACDHRGHGRGTRPSEPFRLADVADDAAALVRHLDLGPVVAVGYSMGGPVAQLLWQRNPDVVAGLVLCATSSSWTASARMRWGWRSMGLLQVLLRLLPRHWWEGLYLAQAEGRLPLRVTQMISDETPKEVLARLPWFVAELDRGSAEDIAEAGRELGRYDARGWLPTVDVPAAVVITTRDVLVPPAVQRDLAGRIPDAAVFEIDADHDAAIAAPDRFVPAVAAGLRHVLDAASQAHSPATCQAHWPATSQADSPALF